MRAFLFGRIFQQVQHSVHPAKPPDLDAMSGLSPMQQDSRSFNQTNSIQLVDGELKQKDISATNTEEKKILPNLSRSMRTE